MCSWYVVGWNLLLPFYVMIHENGWSRIYHEVGKGVSVIPHAETTEGSPIDGAGDYTWHSPLSAFCFIPLAKSTYCWAAVSHSFVSTVSLHKSRISVVWTQGGRHIMCLLLCPQYMHSIATFGVWKFNFSGSKNEHWMIIEFFRPVRTAWISPQLFE